MKRTLVLLSVTLGIFGACGPNDNFSNKAPTPPVMRAVDIEGNSIPATDSSLTAPPEKDTPRKSLAITDPNVVPYGVRARLTRGTWDYLRLTLRDTFKQWGSPRRDDVGINLLLDPGYNYGTHSAGSIRTTPFERFWAYQPGHGCTFADCNSTNLYGVKSGTGQWIQNRAYQAAGQMCNANNTVNGNARGLPNADLQGLHREHGYYVTTGDQCFSEIEVCTPVCSQADICTPHVGHNPAQVCDMAAIDTDTLGIKAEINLGVFVYPHGGVESMPTPLETYNPPDLGTYTGFSSRYPLRTAGARTSSTGCGFFGTCSGSGTGYNWVASGFPASAANYDPFYVHHKDTGSYFRAGDDQAIYLNIGQMQVQSLARGGAANMWYQLKDQQSLLCLAVSGGTASIDIPLILEACDNVGSPQVARQMFQYDYATGYLKSRVGTQTLCVSFSAAVDGASVRLFTCGAGDATHITVFDRPGDKFRNNVPDIVIEAHKGTLTADQQVFTGTAAQNWEFVDSGDPSSKWQQFKDNEDGTCVDISGVNLVHITCNAASLGQYWIYNPGDKTFRSAFDFNQCMDVSGGNYSNGTQVISWPCNGGNNQKWNKNVESGTTVWIQSVGNTNYCLNGDTGSSKVQIYHDTFITTHCTAGRQPEEKWTLIPGALAFGWLRDRDGANCLAVTPASLVNGTVVKQAACIQNDYYQWLFDPASGYIRLKANPAKCLDHNGNNVANATLTIFDCGGARADQQRFDRQGEIIYVRNGFFLTGGVSPSTMRTSRTDNSQLWQQINDKSVTITYSPSMHDCGDSAGLDKIYSGTIDANNEPVYFDALTPQCIRPKSYWVAAKNRWVPCDPFDSYLADGSFNSTRDDNNLIYPAPFGGQTKTCGVAASIYDPGLDSGWYGFKIDSLDLKSDAQPVLADKNSIILTLSTKDLRFEAGMWIDVNLVGGVSGLVSDPKRRWALLNAHALKLVARPKIKLYSIDSDSCLQTGGGCADFWYPSDNQKQDPDRLVVDVELTKTDIDLPMDTPGFSIVSAPTCFVSVIGICAMTTATLLDTVMAQMSDVIKGVLIPMIQDAVKGAVESIPEFNDLLGNPLNLERSLIDVGLYATPEYSAYLPDPTLPEPPRKWPVRIFDGPAVGREITDLRFAVGMKPIAFKLPVVPTGFVTVDPNDPPCAANDARPGCTSLPNPTAASIYGVPTLVDPDTSACFNARGSTYAHRILINGGSYSYNNSSGVMTAMSFTNGSYAAFRAGYVIRDLSTNKTAVVKSVQGGGITLPAGLSTSFDGGLFEVAIGVMSGMTYTLGSTGVLVVGQVFKDDSTGKSTKIIEIRGTELLTENFSSTDFNTANFTIYNCSRISRYPAVDTDQSIDDDDYVLTGSYTDPNTLINYTTPKVIPEYWKGPIDKNKREPTWCATPNELRQFSTPAKFAQLYPQTTWLSFDSTYDKKYTGQAAGPKNTIGEWDQMPAGSVLRQNYNDGSKDPAAIGYDFSLHVHQRTLASLLQAVISSGSACLEFSAQDTTGADTPWKSLLATDRFAAFIPELQSLFPNQYVSVRLFPTRAPHVRTGIGSLSFTPKERIKDPTGGPLSIVAEPYTLGIAFPDLRLEFWVQNPKTGTELRVLSMYWNTVLGFFAKNVRKCYKLDPLFNTPQCDSSQVDVRTVSGYYELFFDLNAPSLQNGFQNATDGFAVGAFSTPGLGTAKGQSAIMIDSTICQTPGKCKLIGLSQAVPSLMSSLLQVFLVTRLQFMNMTLDFLYLGADGPSDDGVPGGDYLAIYARLLGDLNVFDLIGSVSLAPRLDRLPYVKMGGFENERELVFNTNSPVIPITLTSQNGSGNTVDSYTYSVNNGFWHTPVTENTLTLDVLTEGEHKLSVRAINDSMSGAVAQEMPTELHFRIDTVAPEIEMRDPKGWGWGRHIPVNLVDIQTPAEKISATYSVDGGKALDLEGGKIPMNRLSSGRHVVRVSAFDEAGNQANAAKEYHIASGGCSSSQPDAGLLLWIGIALAMLSVRQQWNKNNRR